MFKNSYFKEWAVLRKTPNKNFNFMCNCTIRHICKHVLLMDTLYENELQLAVHSNNNRPLFEITTSYYLCLYIDNTQRLHLNIILTRGTKREHDGKVPIRCNTCAPTLKSKGKGSKSKKIKDRSYKQLIIGVIISMH